ncbi:hypothetical protein B0T24DRAFT_663339 [Lasiosphaeria ovina]|uniref:Uncharacterized protein n=1 Tax=Lasiosphaeria ovina TaxID=92902 RepID=A0AAE0KMT9_9PEZI|nr:hypothetical protein B0T24DRAFT_663339 [Lasiosphaeria ovina]
MNADVFDEYFGYIDFVDSTEALWHTTPATPLPSPATWDTESGFVAKLTAFTNGEIENNQNPQENKPLPLTVVVLKGNARFGEISAQKEHFVQLLVKLGLPRSIVHAIFSNNGQIAHQVEYATDVDGNEHPSALSIVLQTPHSAIKSFSLALRVSTQTNSAVGPLIVEDAGEEAGIISMLSARRDPLRLCPVYTLVVACEELDRRNERWRENLDLTLVQIEKHIGLSAWTHSALDGTPGQVGADAAYETVIRNLHVLNTSLIWLSCTTNFELAMLREAASVVDLFTKTGPALPLAKSATETLHAQIRYLESAAQARQYQRQGLQQRAETQIGIRDNLLNLSIASSSRKIALVSRLDSATVKTISILTLLFLPATLIAHQHLRLPGRRSRRVAALVGSSWLPLSGSPSSCSPWGSCTCGGGWRRSADSLQLADIEKLEPAKVE